MGIFHLNHLLRYKREMEQIIATQADLDKKLDRQALFYISSLYILLFRFLILMTSES